MQSHFGCSMLPYVTRTVRLYIGNGNKAGPATDPATYSTCSLDSADALPRSTFQPQPPPPFLVGMSSPNTDCHPVGRSKRRTALRRGTSSRISKTARTPFRTLQTSPGLSTAHIVTPRFIFPHATLFIEVGATPPLFLTFSLKI